MGKSRCPFRKSGTSVMTRRTSSPRRRASSPHGARLLDSRLRGNDATHQGAAATGSVFMKWTSRLYPWSRRLLSTALFFHLCLAAVHVHAQPRFEGEGRVVAVDAAAYFSRPGPRLVDGLELLGHVLHPELVELPEGVSGPLEVQL